jgi:signal transduction histidine kinase/ligand-binding sensor domain-containing protein
MDFGIPTSIRGQLPSVELRSEPFSNATHCPLGRTESGLQRVAGAKHVAKSSLARTLLSLTVFYFCSTALIWALDPGRRISQYAHTAWRVQDGSITIGTSITQTADGYLWLGTPEGLLRFDGIKFVPFSIPGFDLAKLAYTYLLGARDGSLWIGTRIGVGRLKNGEFQWYSNPAQRSGISVILEDHGGTIWVTRYRVPPDEGPLCRVEGSGLLCYGKADGIPVRYGLGLTEDSLGNFWFGSSVLCRWRQGSVSTYLNGIAKRHDAGNGVFDVAAGPSESIWATVDGVGPDLGVRYYSNGKWAPYVVAGFDGAKVNSHALFVDRDNSLWIGTENDGLYRVHDGVADHFGSADGLSGNSIVDFYEDHEGDLWVVTEGGLDMFRSTPVVTYSMREGLYSSALLSILALQDDSVWIGHEGGVDILKGNRVSLLSAAGGLPGQDVAALFQDHSGVVWLGINSKLVSYEHGRFHEIKRSDSQSPRDPVDAIAEDANHNIWALTEAGHLLRVTNQIAKEVTEVTSDGRQSGYLIPDHDSGIWAASKNGNLVYYRNGSVGTTALKGHDSSFSVLGMLLDSDDSLLVATTEGLFRWDGKVWSVLNRRNGLPCDAIFSAIKDDGGSLWLYSQCGLVKVGGAELRAWRTHGDSIRSAEVFDRFDGARPHMASHPMQPIASKGSDGRLWFINQISVQMIDPSQIYPNKVPPPVHIESVVADHKDYALGKRVRLPPLTRDVEIDYSGLSVAVPQKVHFRYELEGRDTGWQEAGTRRQAFYTNLPPGNYRFRVTACNNSGIWNEAAAFLEFSIVPAYYQTAWFRLTCAAVSLLILWALYQLRLQQLHRQFNIGLEARVKERTRIARDLHDTLLQSLHGLMFEFQAARNMFDRRPEAALQALDGAIMGTERAITESQVAIEGLRDVQVAGNDLAQLLRATGEELVASRSADHDAPTFGLTVEGERRTLVPIIGDEVYRIAREVLRNAFRHAHARRIEAEILYDEHQFRLRIRDDGKGMDPQVLEKGGRAGHWGLPGVRERAQQMGAKLDLWSEAGAGTEVQLTIAGTIAYEKTPDRSGFRLFRRTRNHDHRS